MYRIKIKSNMELQILVSKKGTKVVTATNLHLVLELPNQQYASNIKKWLNEIYQFRDGIRKPERLRDFAKRPNKENSPIDDYYISVEMAKLITLNSKSKKKQKFAKWLLSLEDKVENAELLTIEQVSAVLELTKVMGMVSCQVASEKQHLQTYEERNGGNANNWWQFRSGLLGYSKDKLSKKMKGMGKSISGKSQRQMLMQTDKYEMIRTAVIDLFMAMGKTERYAKNLGNLAKMLAGELNVEIFDDRNAIPAFAPNMNADLMNEVKGKGERSYLKLWES